MLGESNFWGTQNCDLSPNLHNAFPFISGGCFDAYLPLASAWSPDEVVPEAGNVLSR